MQLNLNFFFVFPNKKPKIDVSKLLNSPAGCVDNEGLFLFSQLIFTNKQCNFFVFKTIDDDAPFPTQLSDDVTLKVWRVNDFDRMYLHCQKFCS